MSFSKAPTEMHCGPARHCRRFIVAAAVLLACLGAGEALAQGGPGTGASLPSSIGNANSAANNALFDLTTKFLRDLANQAHTGRFAPGGVNPGGSGAGEQPDPRYRLWGEGYGLWARTGAQNTFTGDERRTHGGIVGLGYTLAPGVNVGVSVDQGHTRTEVSAAAQSATVDLTQIGAYGSIDSGPWTFSVALVHGFGDIESRRSDGGGQITASYDTQLTGIVGEVSYYWSSGNWRVVPKAGLDFTHVKNDAFAESGGTQPVAGSEQVSNRMRAFAGAEAGYSWFAGRTLYDVSAYARAVQLVHQGIESTTVTPIGGTAGPRVVSPVLDGQVELDVGASTSVRFSNLTRLYAVYDGRFRDGYRAHGATLGIEFRW